MNETEASLARIESRLAGIDVKLDRLIDDSEDHERRLRLLERWLWGCIGLSMAGAGSGLWSLLGGQ